MLPERAAIFSANKPDVTSVEERFSIHVVIFIVHNGCYANNIDFNGFRIVQDWKRGSLLSLHADD